MQGFCDHPDSELEYIEYEKNNKMHLYRCKLCTMYVRKQKKI